LPESDLSLLIDAAKDAGKIAARHFGKSPQCWEKGDGQGPVSIADLEIDRMLHARLGTARPDYGWLSEETEDNHDRLYTPATFVIDPIDGTRAFLAGEQTFAHALAVVRDGLPVAGVVHLPLLDLTYWATLGGGAWLNGVQLHTPACSAVAGCTVLGARQLMDAQNWRKDVPEITQHFYPSLAWRLALVAQGKFDAMITLRDTWNWDIAASTLIAQEAGAVVTNRTGAPLRFNTPEPVTAGVVAASANLHRALVDQLA
jgi:myo-inositol-1(or 4)-monophosphatase